MGYFDLFFFKNVICFQIQGLYDVITRNMEGLVTLVFFKIESKNLVTWGIFNANFSKSYIFLNSKLV